MGSVRSRESRCARRQPRPPRPPHPPHSPHSPSASPASPVSLASLAVRLARRPPRPPPASPALPSQIFRYPAPVPGFPWSRTVELALEDDQRLERVEHGLHDAEGGKIAGDRRVHGRDAHVDVGERADGARRQARDRLTGRTCAQRSGMCMSGGGTRAQACKAARRRTHRLDMVCDAWSGRGTSGTCTAVQVMMQLGSAAMRSWSANRCRTGASAWAFPLAPPLCSVPSEMVAWTGARARAMSTRDSWTIVPSCIVARRSTLFTVTNASSTRGTAGWGAAAEAAGTSVRAATGCGSAARLRCSVPLPLRARPEPK